MMDFTIRTKADVQMDEASRWIDDLASVNNMTEQMFGEMINPISLVALLTETANMNQRVVLVKGLALAVYQYGFQAGLTKARMEKLQ